MTESPIRVAMWSGPRNISTAMMRAWENRVDTAVVDEPFYACFLSSTGIVHPMQEEILASQSSNWGEVVADQLSGALQPGQTIQYQKQMTHHMVEAIDESWFVALKHAFLIRHPADVVSSYREKRDTVCAADIGFARQREIFEQARKLGLATPVIESSDVLKDPQRSLSALCSALGVDFDPAMLSWPKGRRDTDGAWAPHWYNKVEESTGFAPYRAKEFELSSAEQAIVDECLDDYLALSEYKI